MHRSSKDIAVQFEVLLPKTITIGACLRSFYFRLLLTFFQSELLEPHHEKKVGHAPEHSFFNLLQIILSYPRSWRNSTILICQCPHYLTRKRTIIPYHPPLLTLSRQCQIPQICQAPCTSHFLTHLSHRWIAQPLVRDPRGKVVWWECMQMVPRGWLERERSQRNMTSFCLVMMPM